MTKIRVLILALVSVLFSCNKQKGTDVTPEKNDSEEPISEQFYSGNIKKDTILMNLTMEGNKILSGKLIYNFYEKDKNEGTLIGELKGDTLLADYTFMSEGISSVRQVVFLKKGDTYIEGYGDIVEEASGKVIFKDRKQLKFDGKSVLSKVDSQSKPL
ncbi:hypothetical protein [Flavobacterium xanthum]|uniref:Uncharacterized protein n=1 Tax=Flavobacterium xanthum TaxID=69322 RepID=A0A1M6YW84_9FLAO|nr:hypothetical protein [Flavobacterium xanthum]SHL22342.1 hypothetical protein SAMN05443669_100428 [Flavobacterium xanthum]